ncbi:fused DSP-PTPase phosphatase/NAD kinase-like protein [Tautonia marina]|uniref:fused DSP-PTPase phosphatase/NAD kinase-like protein n=1 Tax=Tautonia marina TaxID=2653855 RepID=UPI0012610FB6|nr:tyrosine-protein phosphatase [Tautonia marina]
MTRKQILRTIARSLAVLAVLLVIFIGWRWTTGNVGTVEPGSIYRSAQLDGDSLSRLIQSRGIRTVLNLRGPNPQSSWYPPEREATLKAGATLIDVPMSSDYWLTPEQADELIALLDSAERPLLIHCQFGSERTGLVSSMATLLRPGSSLAEARAQFSLYYLFLPLEDGLVMQGHLRQYEQWLEAEGRSHDSETFREWIARSYRPGTPNRSLWPYNPYPLRVVTRPEDAAVRH